MIKECEPRQEMPDEDVAETIHSLIPIKEIAEKICWTEGRILRLLEKYPSDCS
jgi:hypothetical protein